MLETANRESELYEQNDCGPDEDLNCGYFYMGQGYADLRAAMEPDGELDVATAGRVDGDRERAANSFSVWSPAFGNAIAGNAELLEDSVAFDDLGRDYTVDLSGRNVAGAGHGQRVFQRMRSRLARTGFSAPVAEELAPGVSMTSRLNEAGQPATGRVDATLGRATVSAFGFEGGESNPMDDWM